MNHFKISDIHLQNVWETFTRLYTLLNSSPHFRPLISKKSHARPFKHSQHKHVFFIHSFIEIEWVTFLPVVEFSAARSLFIHKDLSYHVKGWILVLTHEIFSSNKNAYFISIRYQFHVTTLLPCILLEKIPYPTIQSIIGKPTYETLADLYLKLNDYKRNHMIYIENQESLSTWYVKVAIQNDKSKFYKIWN